MEIKKQSRSGHIVVSIVAIVVLQFVAVPLMNLVVDVLFGITWSMTPVYIAWSILVSVAIIISLLIRNKMKPISRKVIWFSLTLVTVSFSISTIWAGAISSMPGY